MFITFCLVVGATVVMGAQLTVEIKVDVAAPKDVSGSASQLTTPFTKRTISFVILLLQRDRRKSDHKSH